MCNSAGELMQTALIGGGTVGVGVGVKPGFKSGVGEEEATTVTCPGLLLTNHTPPNARATQAQASTMRDRGSTVLLIFEGRACGASAGAAVAG